MLKRIWHAITGNHKWERITKRTYLPSGFSYVPTTEDERKALYGFERSYFRCDCGARLILEVLGAFLEDAKDELTELRKMAGLK